MANFVKWRGPHLAQGSPSIGRTIQSVEVGKAFRFGIWGGDGLDVKPNDFSVAQMNPRASVEQSSNNISWFELVGRRAGNVMIEARHPSSGGVWDYFQLAVRAAKEKVRPPVRGINYDYAVDTKGIGPDTNASIILNLKIALKPMAAGIVVTDDGGANWTSKQWSTSQWMNWTRRFKSLIESNWSKKFWISTPSALTELEVAKPGGGKSRVHLHCVLKVDVTSGGKATHRIDVVKAGASDGVQFRSNSTRYDDADLRTDPPTVTGLAATTPFNTALHEIGHTLGLHHPCESTSPSAPYCVAADPDVGERMGQGGELRARYATPWQNAAASWFNSSGRGHDLKPGDFTAYTYRIAPADV